MRRKRPVIFWIMVGIVSLGGIEAVSSVYYFQKEQSDSPLAALAIWHSLKKKVWGTERIEQINSSIYVSDDRFGYSPKKNSTVFKNCWTSQVQYTIGPNSERVIPTPQDSRGQILFLGGSETFGSCVADHENYPYILATEYWKDWQVQNRAVSGWATHQAYMALSDSIKSKHPPSLVMYGMTPDQIRKNYLRKSGWQNTSESWRQVPHFELIQGDLVFQGVVGPSAGIEAGLALRTKENEMTAAYLSAMQRMCHEKNIPFVVIFLPPSDRYPLSVFNHFYQANIRFLDLTALEIEGLNPGKDTHPNPDDHRRIAAAIASSFISDILASLEGTRKE